MHARYTINRKRGQPRPWRTRAHGRSYQNNISGAGEIGYVSPVLYGLDGEDGSVQVLADITRVPLVGCGILGSATSLDKNIAKQLLRSAGLTGRA